MPGPVEDFTGTAEHGGDDVRVGGKKPGSGGRNPSVDAVNLCGAEAVEEMVEGHPHHHRHHGTVPTGSIANDRVAEQVLGRIRTPLRHRAVIDIDDPVSPERLRHPIPCGPQLLPDQRVDARPDQPRRFRWHVPDEAHHSVRLRDERQRSSLPADRIPWFGTVLIESVAESGR